MTTRNIVETIQTVFPKLGEAQIAHEINNAIREFATKSGSVQGLYKLTNTDQYIGWKLPDKILRVTEVDAFGPTGKRVYLSAYGITWDVKGDFIIFYDATGETLIRIPDAIYDLYIWTEELADEVVIPFNSSKKETDIGDVLDEKYHEGIEAKVLAKAYLLYPVEMVVNGAAIKSRDWNAVKYHEMKFRDAVLEAIRERNKTRRDGYDILMHDYAGHQDVVKPDKTNLYDDAIIILDVNGNVGLRWEELGTQWQSI